MKFKKTWIFLLLSLSLYGCSSSTASTIKDTVKSYLSEDTGSEEYTADEETQTYTYGESIEDILSSEITDFDAEFAAPEYTGELITIMNDNQPWLDAYSAGEDSFEIYGELDELGRCTTAYANIGRDLMPTTKRESISSVKPTGWINNPYDFVDGGYLYNRSHLIAYQLTAENANVNNLITGTRYFNATGMVPYENEVADYIKQTDNHVLYRVTPVFEGDDLLAKGVYIEALSVEDNGEGVCFNVFVHNVQPGVDIDYATGANHVAEETGQITTYQAEEGQTTYILNTSSKRFHLPECSSAQKISEQNRLEVFGSAQELLDMGYSPCQSCLSNI